jgi:hypothetical protein
MIRFRHFMLFIVAVALVAAACSSSGGDPAGTDAGGSDSGVVLGRGSVPATVPDGFPIPEEAVIGATMIDPDRGVTEMVMSMPASLPAAVDYYVKNLPIAGYELTSSGGSDVDWELIFFDADVHGVIGVNAAGDGLSTVSVRFTDT